MHRITKNIGTSGSDLNTSPIVNSEIKRILICRPNKRLGNLLLITPLLQEVIATFPGSKIDLFVKGNLASSVFKNYENVDRIIRLPQKAFKHFAQYIHAWTSIKTTRYDLVINVVTNSSSGRLSARFANSKYKFFGDTDEDIQSKYSDYGHMAKFPVYGLRTYLNNGRAVENNKPIPTLDLRLSSSEIAEGEKKLRSLVNNDKATICLFTYATGDKCYPTSWWEDFYERLKTEYPGYNIIEVLPVENISNLSFKVPTFSSKDVREVGSLIANTQLFISADGGIMHLGSSAQAPTIGLFSVTNPENYQPYNDNSMGINTNISTIEELIEATHKILLNHS